MPLLIWGRPVQGHAPSSLHLDLVLWMSRQGWQPEAGTGAWEGRGKWNGTGEWQNGEGEGRGWVSPWADWTGEGVRGRNQYLRQILISVPSPVGPNPVTWNCTSNFAGEALSSLIEAAALYLGEGKGNVFQGCQPTYFSSGFGMQSLKSYHDRSLKA